MNNLDDFENEEYNYENDYHNLNESESLNERIYAKPIIKPFAFISKNFNFNNKSKEITEEWFGYYENLYKTEEPDFELFKYLLDKNGFPPIKNHYTEGNLMKYRFCDDFINLSEIDFVLNRWQSKMLESSERIKQKNKIKENEEKCLDDLEYKSDEINTINKDLNDDKEIFSLIRDINSNWSHLFSHSLKDMYYRPINNNQNDFIVDWSHKQEVMNKTAIDCLVYLFLSKSKNWSWIKEQLHQDNIRLLCRIVYDHTSSENQEKLLKVWIDAGWISESSIKWFLK